MTNFTHLHLHTRYSFLDGMCGAKDVAARCSETGMSACAVTDHRHAGGLIGFYKTLKDKGIKPILGMEADVQPVHGGSGIHHLVLLAQNGGGYDNLRALATLQQQGPLSLSQLVDHQPGLAFLTSCVAGEVPGHVARGDMDKAREVLKVMSGALGNVYVELQPTAGPHLRANPRLQELAADLGLKCVVTNDVHYPRPEDAEAQNVLMAIRQGKRLGDNGLHRHPEPVYFMRDGDEMREACLEAGIDLEHMATTNQLAAECNVDLDLGKPDLPPFSDDDDESLDEMAWAGLKSRSLVTKDYNDRLAFELDVITDMGYCGYFLIVQDFVNWAREQGQYIGPGRGSGCGSLVAYALGITDLDPLEHKLFFERFLNPERVSMPDFDIDFMQARRGEVIDYVVDKYGRDNVGQIATYMSLHPKSAIKDVARTLGLPYSEINELVKEIPSILKKYTPEQEAMSEFDLALSHAPLLAANDDYKKLLSIARQLTGCMRQTGKHAGGVVIGRLPLEAYTPLTADGRTQYDMNDVEAAGLVKFDFLGVKTLDTIKVAADDVGVEIRNIVTDDAAVFKVIADGDTWGLFQVESPGMTVMCTELKPDRFDDIVAAVALYRPGPMESGVLASFIKRKHGEEEIEYADERLDQVLADTYGTIVYQEQVMQTAQVLAGYSLGGADLLRRAMGKKKQEEMDRQRQVFVDGCGANNVTADVASEIFDGIAKHAGYSFNRSHAAGYALLTYQTAWLKLYHPLAFTASLLTIEGSDQDKLSHYVRCARGSGISIVAPDINSSQTRFTVDDGVVRWGLGAIKGIGGAMVPKIIAGQPYSDFYDLAERGGLTASTLKILVASGACDRFHDDRDDLLASISSGVARSKKKKVADIAGQMSMLGAMAVVYEKSVSVMGEAGRLEAERKALGSFMSGHPASDLDCVTPSTFFGEGQEVTGVVVDVFSRRTRKGKMWAKVTIEDEDKVMRLLAFPSAYEDIKTKLVIGGLTTFTGHVNGGGEFVVEGAME